MYRYKLTPKQLAKANHPNLAQLAKDDWTLVPNSMSHEQLLMDFERGHAINDILHKDAVHSVTPYLTPCVAGIDTIPELDEETRTKLYQRRHDLFDNFLKDQFGDKAELLWRSYDQTLQSLMCDCLNYYLFTKLTYKVDSNDVRDVKLYKKDKDIYLEANFDVINLSNPDLKIIRLAGAMSLRWRLTDQGFKVECMSASNRDLLDIICGNHSSVEAAIAKDAYKKAELEFIKAQSSPDLDNRLTNKAVDVYLETKRLSRQKGADHKKLTDVLERTTHLLKCPEDKSKANEYVNLGKQLQGRRSKFKLLAGAMLVFAGAALTLGSIGVGIATFGFSTPLSALGIAGGVAVAGGGAALGVSALVGGAGLGIFGRRKRLSKAACRFGKACKKQKFAKMTQHRSPEEQAVIDMPTVNYLLNH